METVVVVVVVVVDLFSRDAGSNMVSLFSRQGIDAHDGRFGSLGERVEASKQPKPTFEIV